MKIELRFQIFQSNGSFFARRNSELGLDFAIRWERNKISRKKNFSGREELCFFDKIQENFEIKYFAQKYTFRKKNSWTCKFRFWQRCQKVFAQNPSSFSEISRQFQLLVQFRLKLFRFLSEVCTLNCTSGPTVYMFDNPVAKRWHGKNLVTLKLAVLGDFFPLPVVQITYNLHGFRMNDLKSQKIL